MQSEEPPLPRQVYLWDTPWLFHAYVLHHGGVQTSRAVAEPVTTLIPRFHSLVFPVFFFQHEVVNSAFSPFSFTAFGFQGAPAAQFMALFVLVDSHQAFRFTVFTRRPTGLMCVEQPLLARGLLTQAGKTGLTVIAQNAVYIEDLTRWLPSSVSVSAGCSVRPLSRVITTVCIITIGEIYSRGQIAGRWMDRNMRLRLWTWCMSYTSGCARGTFHPCRAPALTAVEPRLYAFKSVLRRRERSGIGPLWGCVCSCGKKKKYILMII